MVDCNVCVHQQSCKRNRTTLKKTQKNGQKPTVCPLNCFRQRITEREENGVIKSENPYWVYYRIKNATLDTDKTGKWMYFFDDINFARKICQDAVEKDIVKSVKHSNKPDGVSCFYIHYDDIIAHKKVIQFFRDNNLIQKTKKGRLYNISFKRDRQTLRGEYGEEYSSMMKLDLFLNLETGEWLEETEEWKENIKSAIELMEDDFDEFLFGI